MCVAVGAAGRASKKHCHLVETSRSGSCVQVLLIAIKLIHIYLTLQLTVRDALNNAMDEEMEKDKDVFILGEEVRGCPCDLRMWRAC